MTRVIVALGLRGLGVKQLGFGISGVLKRSLGFEVLFGPYTKSVQNPTPESLRALNPVRP